MGSTNLKEIQYGTFISDKKEGESQIIRNPLRATQNLLEKSVKGIESIWDGLTLNLKTRGGDKNFVGYRKKLGNDLFEDQYTWLTYNEFIQRAENFSKGLRILNLCPEIENDNTNKLYSKLRLLGIYSKNNLEWLLAYFGSCRDNITIVTLYDTLGESAIEFILTQTKLTTILIESKSLIKIKKLIINKKIKYLQNLIVINKEDQDSVILKEIKNFGNIKIFTCEEIEQIGFLQGKDIVLNKASLDSISTICYTSGTSGQPKGAMISQRALTVQSDLVEIIELDISNDIYLSYLPYAHIMECLIVTAFISRGAQIGLYSGNVSKLTEDAQILKPTLMSAVPRVFQRVYNGIVNELKKVNVIHQKIFNKALSSKMNDLKEKGELKNVIWDNTVFKKARNILGGRLRFMLVGSAPTEDYILNFLKCVLSCSIVEGYGLTESCAAALLTKVRDPVSQHVGGPGLSCEVKLKDVPDLGYSTEDLDDDGNNVPRGEICIRGPLLFSGYFNDEEKTKEVFDEEGWFHTGDVGMLIPGHGNAIKIIDRVKNIFKLQQGEYIAPEKLENILINNKYVEQIFVTGEPTKNYLVAILVPKAQEVIKFLNSHFEKQNENSVDITNYKDYFENEDLIKEILKDMEQYGRENDFKGFEVIKNVYLSRESFTEENGLVTPTLKIKRQNLKNRFITQINKMYGTV